jgi:hypothetical protein
MSKSRRNISLPDEYNQKLDREEINASGLITNLLRAYFALDSKEEAAELVADMKSQTQTAMWEDCCEALRETELRRTNDAVLNWAGKLECPPEKVIGAVQHYRKENELPEELK